MGETLKLQPSEGDDLDGDKGEKKPWAPVVDGEFYEAKVIKVGRITKPFTDDNDNPIEKYEFVFRITEEGEFKGHWIRGETPTNFINSDRCKMRNWVQEMLCMELPGDYALDLDEVKNKPVRIQAAVQRKLRNEPGPNGETHWVNEWVKDVFRPKGAKFITLEDIQSEEPF